MTEKQITLERWGFPNGVTNAAAPMRDGYWTPWHIAQAEIERLTAERKVPEWQPIETAPKDGSEVLLYRPLAANSHDPVFTIRCGVKNDHGCWPSTIPEGMDATNYTDGYCKATRWMPLPAAPKVTP